MFRASAAGAAAARLVRAAAPMPAAAAARGVHVEAILAQKKIELRPPAKSVANYIMCNRVGNLVYTAGHLPATGPNSFIVGKVGSELTTEQAYEAARVVIVNMLSTLKAELGDLDRVKRVVKVMAFVNCVDSYQSHPKVVNGASDLLVEVFGEKGRHARSAVGTNSLPLNVPVEIEAIIEVE